MQSQIQLFTSLLRVGRGWFANHALRRTAAGRRGCNRRASWPPSLNLGLGKQVALFAGLLIAAGAVAGATVTLESVADVELRQGTPTAVIGGDTFVAGGLGLLASNELRRGVLRFDLASLPTNAVVRSVELRLQIMRVPTASANSVFELRRLLTDWIEAETTWNQRKAAVAWDVTGAGGPGDIAPVVSATADVAGLGRVAFISTPALVADIRSWLVDPGNNHGWSVRSQAETTLRTARHFATRESVNSADRPQLVITFIVPPVLYQVRRDQGDLAFSFAASPGQAYHLETRTNLFVGSWRLERTFEAIASEQVVTERIPIVLNAEASFLQLRAE